MVYFKCEDLQMVCFYKLCGVYNLLVQLFDEELVVGVVCFFVGNYVQGFVYVCCCLGVYGWVYVFVKIFKQKCDWICYYGGEFIDLIVGGLIYDLVVVVVFEDVECIGVMLVLLFDDLCIIVGQGMIVVEVFGQFEDELDLVVVLVGGGGCIVGIIIYLVEWMINIVVLGVELVGVVVMMVVFVVGELVMLDYVDQFVDGVVVNWVGMLIYVVLVVVGDMVLFIIVDEGVVCMVMFDLYQNEGIIVELVGVLLVVGLLEVDIEFGFIVVCLILGGNNDVFCYGEVLECLLVYLGFKYYFLVDFLQEFGVLCWFFDDVFGFNDDIILFEYVKCNNWEIGEVLVGIELGLVVDLDGLLVWMWVIDIYVEVLELGLLVYCYLLQ